MGVDGLVVADALTELVGESPEVGVAAGCSDDREHDATTHTNAASSSPKTHFRGDLTRRTFPSATPLLEARLPRVCREPPILARRHPQAGCHPAHAEAGESM
ncbi:MAG: hypothetical protein ACOYBY_09410 [Dermatophilaceae bacterium]